MHKFFYSNKHTIVKGNINISSACCIFASYPVQGLSTELLMYLTHIKNLKYSIVFVSNTPVSQENLTQLQALCSYIIVRPNFGRDFGAYKTGVLFIENHYKNHIKSLILCNDSVYGPIFPLAEMFNSMTRKNIDFWGVSESCNTQPSYHVSSYFLVFNFSILKRGNFWNFWHNYKETNVRNEVIWHGEIGLNQFLLINGYKGQCYISREKILSMHEKVYRNTQNTTYSFYRDTAIGKSNLRAATLNHKLTIHTHYIVDPFLMHFLRWPFIKKDLLKRNNISQSEFTRLFASETEIDIQKIYTQLVLAKENQTQLQKTFPNL